MIIRLSIRRSSLRFLPPVAAFFFSAIAGISVAAWLDAPNAPPNYGLTPPYTQNDFRPMNLGTSPQTKNGSMAIVGTLIATSTTPTSFPNFPGNVVASGFYDSEGTGYFLDPATISGYSGVFSSSVGIRQRYPGASFAVNNDSTSPTREASGKIGSLNDAIYAYANSINAALSAEQGNPAGYAIYATGGINYFHGNVGIGTTTPGQKLTVAGTIESTSGGVKFPDGTTQTTAASAGVVAMRFFATNGVWTKPAGVNKIYVEVLGGGGGGGGSYYGTLGSGGGGGGGYARGVIDVSTISMVNITIGPGGGGGGVDGLGYGVAGGNGGASSFGSLVGADGGAGGQNNLGSGAGGAGGDYGGMGVYGGAPGSAGTGRGSGDLGGNSGNGAKGGGLGANGSNYGAGGGGNTYGNGGGGAQGVVIVWEYQ